MNSRTSLESPKLEAAGHDPCPATGHADPRWEQYARSRDVGTRNALIEAYLPIVKCEARKLAAALANTVSPQELESAGTLGLIDCIDSFDPAQGFRFITFCTPRVRGAMFDELRSWDWTPRATRAKLNRLDRTLKKLEHNLGRSPDDDEIAEDMGLTEDEIRQLYSDKNRTLVSLDRTWGDAGDAPDDSPMSVLEDKRGGDPLHDLQKKEITESIRQSLTPAERLVVMLYYYEQLTLLEIGRVLGVTESRVCQIHSKIVRRLKRQFA